MFRRFSPCLFAVLFLAGWLGAGCSTPVNRPATSPAMALGSDILRAGDKITVVLSDVPNGPITSDQVVGEDGYITLHLNYRLLAAGKTRGVLQNEIHEHYVPKFYLHCTVTIKAEDRFFYVNGEVKLPNRYMYSGDLTVLKAVTAAGGFTDFAKRWAVTVTRLNGETITVDCDKALRDPSLDVPIYPGDRITVEKRIV